MSISSEKLRKVLHPIQIDTMLFASNPAEILALKASTAQLTGQQWVEVGPVEVLLIEPNGLIDGAHSSGILAAEPLDQS